MLSLRRLYPYCVLAHAKYKSGFNDFLLKSQLITNILFLIHIPRISKQDFFS